MHSRLPGQAPVDTASENPQLWSARVSPLQMNGPYAERNGKIQLSKTVFGIPRHLPEQLNCMFFGLYNTTMKWISLGFERSPTSFCNPDPRHEAEIGQKRTKGALPPSDQKFNACVLKPLLLKIEEKLRSHVFSTVKLDMDRNE